MPPRFKIDSSRFRKLQEKIIREKETQVNVFEVPKLISGPPGLPGVPGSPGLQGIPGLAPEHETDGKRIRFKNPDGSWGEWINLDGGYYPGSSPVVYRKIQQASFIVNKHILINGTNIFGVNYAGDVTITLPAIMDTNKVIIIKDESGAASSNNITIQGEN